MDSLLTAAIASGLILLASLASVELGVSVAIVVILSGIVGGNLLGLRSTAWLGFLAAFASIVLTFLAGAEVDPVVLRDKWKESLLIGGLSMLVPFVAAMAFTYWALGWSGKAPQIAGVALSTASLAVVYAVLVETGLTTSRIGKIIMAATFVTDFGTALALSLLLVRPGPMLIVLVLVSTLLIVLVPRISPWFFRRYGNQVIEPGIKPVFAALFLMMFVAGLGHCPEEEALLLQRTEKALTARSLMVRDVPATGPDAPLDETLYKLVNTPLRRVMAVDESGRVLGIILDSDLLARFQPESPGRVQALIAWLAHMVSEPLQMDGRAADVLTRPVFTVQPETPLAQVAQEMIDKRVKRLVVTDAEGRLVGMVDRQTLLRALSSDLRACWLKGS
jgi:CBS domain-containing protein